MECLWCLQGNKANAKVLAKFCSPEISDKLLQSMVCNLAGCLNCVMSYHYARRYFLKRDESAQKELFTWEVDRLREHLENALHPKTKITSGANNNVDWEKDETLSGDDLLSELSIPLQEILNYPYLLWDKDLASLTTEALLRLEDEDSPIVLHSKFPGVYLLLIYPICQVRKWAKKSVHSLGYVSCDDYDDLSEVVQWIMNASEFDLLNSQNLEENTIFPSHLFVQDSKKEYWDAVCALLKKFDSTTIRLQFLSPDHHSQFLTIVLTAMDCDNSRNYGRDSEFWPLLSCLLIVLKRLGSRIWQHINIKDHVELFSSIVLHPAYLNEVKRLPGYKGEDIKIEFKAPSRPMLHDRDHNQMERSPDSESTRSESARSLRVLMFTLFKRYLLSVVGFGDGAKKVVKLVFKYLKNLKGEFQISSEGYNSTLDAMISCLEFLVKNSLRTFLNVSARRWIPVLLEMLRLEVNKQSRVQNLAISLCKLLLQNRKELGKDVNRLVTWLEEKSEYHIRNDSKNLGCLEELLTLYFREYPPATRLYHQERRTIVMPKSRRTSGGSTMNNRDSTKKRSFLAAHNNYSKNNIKDQKPVLNTNIPSSSLLDGQVLLEKLKFDKRLNLSTDDEGDEAISNTCLKPAKPVGRCLPLKHPSKIENMESEKRVEKSRVPVVILDESSEDCSNNDDDDDDDDECLGHRYSRLQNTAGESKDTKNFEEKLEHKINPQKLLTNSDIFKELAQPGSFSGDDIWTFDNIGSEGHIGLDPFNTMEMLVTAKDGPSDNARDDVMVSDIMCDDEANDNFMDDDEDDVTVGDIVDNNVMINDIMNDDFMSDDFMDDDVIDENASSPSRKRKCTSMAASDEEICLGSDDDVFIIDVVQPFLSACDMSEMKADQHKETQAKKPRKDSNKLGIAMPNDDGEELNQVKPRKDSDELNIAKLNNDGAELNVVKPRRDGNELNLTKSKSDAKEQSIINLKIDSDQLHIMKPRCDGENVNMIKPNNDSDKLHILKPNTESNHLRIMKPKNDYENIPEQKNDGNELNIVKSMDGGESIVIMKQKTEEEERNIPNQKNDGDELNVITPMSDGEDLSTMKPKIEEELKIPKRRNDGDELNVIEPTNDDEAVDMTKTKNDVQEPNHMPKNDEEKLNMLKRKINAKELNVKKLKVDGEKLKILRKRFSVGTLLTEIAESRKSSDGDVTLPAPKIAKTAQVKPPVVRSVSAPLPSKDSRVQPKKPIETKPSKPLALDELYRVILKWDPNMLKRNFSLDMPNCSKVKLTYETMDDYYNVFKPLLFLECWAQALRAWQQLSSDGRVEQTVVVKSVKDFSVHFLLVTCHKHISRKSNCEEKIARENDLVIVKMQDGNLRPLFAVVESVKQERSCWKPGDERDEHSKSDVQYFDLTITIRLIPKDHRLIVNETICCVVVTSLVPTLRQWQGMMFFPRSLLARDILQPRIDRCCNNKLNREDSNVIQVYNKSQSAAIYGTSAALQLPYPIPRISFIQGPPGTGKSHTIIGLIKTHLNNRENQLQAEKANRLPGSKVSDVQTSGRVLLCAPSNAAVYVLVRRLIAEMKSSTGKENVAVNGKNCGSINLVCVGRTSAVHPEVVPFALDTLSKAEVAKRATTHAAEEKNAQGKVQAIREKMEALEKRRYQLRLAGYEDGSKEMKFMNCKVASVVKEKQKLEKEYLHIRGKSKMLKHEEDKIRKEVLSAADVICCTLSASGSVLLHKLLKTSSVNLPFACVIVDEACQSSELDLLIPLQFGSSKLVMVGDPEQLRSTVISKKAQELLLGQSMYERLYKVFQKRAHSYGRALHATEDNPIQLLDLQYRMHPQISSFPTRYIYQGRVRDEGSLGTRECISSLKPYALLNVKNGIEEFTSSGSLCNPVEGNLVVEICSKLKQEVFEDHFGVITPYRAQVNLLQKRLKERGLKNVEVDTVDGFQGREKDVVIMSCVRANEGHAKGIGFLADRTRLNVALTRSKHSLVILLNVNCLETNNDWKACIDDARQRRVLFDVSSPKDLSQVFRNNNDVEAEQSSSMLSHRSSVPNLKRSKDKLPLGASVPSEKKSKGESMCANASKSSGNTSSGNATSSNVTVSSEKRSKKDSLPKKNRSCVKEVLSSHVSAPDKNTSKGDILSSTTNPPNENRFTETELSLNVNVPKNDRSDTERNSHSLVSLTNEKRCKKDAISSSVNVSKMNESNMDDTSSSRVSAPDKNKPNRETLFSRIGVPIEKISQGNEISSRVNLSDKKGSKKHILPSRNSVPSESAVKEDTLSFKVSVPSDKKSKTDAMTSHSSVLNESKSKEDVSASGTNVPNVNTSKAQTLSSRVSKPNKSTCNKHVLSLNSRAAKENRSKETTSRVISPSQTTSNTDILSAILGDQVNAKTKEDNLSSRANVHTSKENRISLHVNVPVKKTSSRDTLISNLSEIHGNKCKEGLARSRVKVPGDDRSKKDISILHPSVPSNNRSNENNLSPRVNESNADRSTGNGLRAHVDLPIENASTGTKFSNNSSVNVGLTNEKLSLYLPLKASSDSASREDTMTPGSEEFDFDDYEPDICSPPNNNETHSNEQSDGIRLDSASKNSLISGDLIDLVVQCGENIHAQRNQYVQQIFTHERKGKELNISEVGRNGTFSAGGASILKNQDS